VDSDPGRRPDDADLETCVEILSYLDKRPRARDTFEGVVRWWMLRFRFDQEARRLRDAVTLLSESGFLMRDRRADGNDHLRLPEGGADVGAFLRRFRGEP
jgi:hypothetical protein